MGPCLWLVFGPHLCQWKYAALAPRNVLGCRSGSSLTVDLCYGEVVFSHRSFDLLSMSYDRTHVTIMWCTLTSHNGQRSELSDKSRQSLFPCNEQWSRGLQTHSHAHAVALWAVWWVIMMSEGVTDWAFIPSLSMVWIIALEVFQASCFLVFHFLLLLSRYSLLFFVLLIYLLSHPRL